jgi:lambda family phage minor tail protein L
MSVRADVATLQPQALIEVFEFDPTNIGQTADKILRWHPGTQVDKDPIVWRGVTYQPYPVESDGFEQSAVGKLPRPTLRAANIGGALGAFLASMQDGMGAKVTRRRTLAKYLDAVNFPGGNPHADPNAHFEDEIFYISRKVAQNPIFIEIELAVPFDIMGTLLPRRQVIAGTCQWVYRSTECSYAGPAIKNDPIYPDSGATTTTDKCGKTLAACVLRFPKPQALRTSAFPASLLARYG